jgi:hypothetical protein
VTDAEPYFYDPTSGFTAWKHKGEWRVAMGPIWSMQRETVAWHPAGAQFCERFEELSVSV